MYIRISSDGVFEQGTPNIGLFEFYTIINYWIIQVVHMISALIETRGQFSFEVEA